MPRVAVPMSRRLVLLAGLWSTAAWANHDGMAEKLAVVFVLVAAASISAMTCLGATIWFVVKARKSGRPRDTTWCRRLAIIDCVLSATAAILFVVALPSADAPKLLVPAAAFAVAGVLAWQSSRSAPIPV
jgi:heme/copper-type cytochrome/quinol oxidase subunit 2